MMVKKRFDDKGEELPPHIHQRRRKYYWFLRLEDPDQPGTRRPVWSSGYATLGEAKIALAQIKLKQELGERTITSGLLMRDYLPAWLESKRDIKDTTRHSYRRSIDGHLLPHLGDVPLGRLTPEHIDAMITHLLTKGAARGKPLAHATVRYAYTVLNYALNDAIKRRHITFNPARAVSLPKRREVDKRVQYWTRDELAAFYAKAGDHWIVPLVQVAVNTGMRRGELLGLRWSDLADDYTHVTVQATRTSIGSEVVEGTPKNHKSRHFALGSTAREALRSIRAQQAQQRLAAGPAWENGTADLVFVDELGAPYAPGRVTNEFKRLVARTKVRPIRLHDLRHTHATLALSAGVRPKVVSERLGHATVAFTEDIYGHVIPADDDAAADAIDRAIN